MEVQLGRLAVAVSVAGGETRRWGLSHPGYIRNVYAGNRLSICTRARYRPEFQPGNRREPGTEVKMDKVVGLRDAVAEAAMAVDGHAIHF